MFFLFRKYEVLLLFTPFVLVLERALVLVVEVNWCGSFGRRWSWTATGVWYSGTVDVCGGGLALR